MATGDVSIKWGTAAAVTIAIASLATSSTKLVGVESDAIDLSGLGPITDVLFGGKITTGTTPTTAKSIEVWAIGSYDGTNYPSVFDGTGSAETLPSAEQKVALMGSKLIASMGTNATSDTAYEFNSVSLAALFSGSMPKKIVLFVTHDTAVNLNSTGGNHFIYYQPVYENVA
jgi:hypothetical protein